MLDSRDRTMVELPREGPAYLTVVVDTEESFDWHAPLSRDNTTVDAFEPQAAAQDIFDRFRVVPTYVIDYPVATDTRAAAYLAALAGEGRCEIGAHLHPWVNQPHEETVNQHNSFPGNLPAELERRKLEALTAAIADRLGRRPVAYKAGRYGVGRSTADALRRLGYLVDLSVVPHTDFAKIGGPDFSGFDHRPWWIGGGHSLLELPLTVGFAGALRRQGGRYFPHLSGPLGMNLHFPGIAARLGLMERIRLSPEGADTAALRRVTEALLDQGCRFFCLAYHSPSLLPGRTPYVRDDAQLRQFLDTLRRYLGYFIDERGGVPTTPTEMHQIIRDGGARSI